VIHGLWTTPAGDTFSHDGAHYPVADSPALPKPVQQPHPPIIIGGGGAKRTPALVARYANEFNTPFMTPDDARAAFARVQAACDAAGRDPAELTLSSAVVLCCGADDAEVAKRAAVIGRDPDELRTNGAAGTPAEVIAKLRAYQDLGATRAYLQVLDLDDLDHLRLVAAEVLGRV
jgi:alkanesulfonate monooxygenase SsuD/methylene tetrahydromethanopterin reductase-like flavin-dependent oxidoreductase (luciferase family)